MSETFFERLWPSRTAAMYLVLLSVTFGAAAGREYGSQTGWTVLAVSVAISTLGWWVTSPIITVTPEGFRAGKATVPWNAIGRIRALDKKDTAATHGINAHPLAFYLVRGWIPESVFIEIVDSTDPHPYWQVSSRKTRQLVAVLENQQRLRHA